MKKLPKILVVGRPNVGKSTFINRVLKKKKAITVDYPGVTRDLAYFPVSWKDRSFMLVDSGGVFFAKSADIHLQDKIEEKVKQEIEDARLIIFMLDYQEGLHPADHTIAKYLRRFSDKVCVVINKVDNDNSADVHNFQKLGFGTPKAISSIHGSGVTDLLDSALADFGGTKGLSGYRDGSYRVAIVGRPNVGKSSLINAILNEDRMIVDDQAGTTRDAVDFYFLNQEKRYLLTDTAGIRRRAKIKESIEFYSFVRSQKSIKSAHLVLVVLDATAFLSDMDKKIIRYVLDQRRNMIIFVNKWDLIKDKAEARKQIVRLAERTFPALKNYPFLFGSAKEKTNLGQIFNQIPKIISRSETRISTSKLNQFVNHILKVNPPPSRKGRTVNIYYGTQVESSPPLFIFFVNHPGLIDAGYHRFLENRLRAFFADFTGVSVHIVIKKHSQTKDEAAD